MKIGVVCVTDAYDADFGRGGSETANRTSPPHIYNNLYMGAEIGLFSLN